ncbi:MAG: S8 family peptidase [Candidatus Eiseniibacteriota bacterium]
MVTAREIVAFLCAVSGTLFPTSVRAASGADDDDELVVGFHRLLRPESERVVHDVAGARFLRRSPDRAVALVRVREGSSVEEVMAAYRGRPEVAFVHPNHVGGGGLLPDDTGWAALWHHQNLGQSGGTTGADLESPAGWDLHRGSPSVTVAVLDTGVDIAHPEFAGRLLPGWDFANDDDEPADDHGHGTWVTGVIAANAGNGFGTAGVDHFCSILPVKVLGATNLGTTFDLISGIDFARLSGADVINMSLVNFPSSPGLDAALAAAKSAGCVLVACAGNAGLGDADVSWPGASPHTISVGATTALDVRAGFSGTGAALELVAPGKDVVTVLHGTSADGTTLFTGCSAATPIVSGIAGILRAIDPTLDTDAVLALLRAGAEDQVGDPAEDAPGWDPYYGFGRVNLRRTLEATLRVGVPGPPASGSDLALTVSPNPARRGTAAVFSLPASGRLRISVHDVAGRTVRVLTDGQRGAGSHVVTWDSRDDRGGILPAGVYFLRAESPHGAQVEKVTLLR